MIPNSAARQASSHASDLSSVTKAVFKAKRRTRAHAVVVSTPWSRAISTSRTAPQSYAIAASSRVLSPCAKPSSITPKSSAILTTPRSNTAPSVSPFSTSTIMKKKHGNKNASISGSSPVVAKSTTSPVALKDEVLYRKEGTKIVPVNNAADDVDTPVSGLFSQYQDFSKPTSAPEPMTSKALGSNELDLSALTLADVFPPDDFVKQLIQQRKLNVTVDETKDLIQTMIDVLPLRGDDPKRVQVEKEFRNVCKKKNLNVYELGSWSVQYTRDGAPLALALYKIAIDNGDLISKYSYGVMLYRGARGVPADPVKGRAIIESLAKPPRNSRYKGLPWAMSTLASIYARDDKNFEAARDMYLAAANQGVTEARVTLGRMYLNGELPRDVEQAKKCFQLAIKLEDFPEAHFLLGALEMQEEKPNHKTAFQHYQRAASKGLAEAQYNVGQAYFTGLGVPKNDALAVEYWKMSGQQGFGLAQLSLGAYYFQDETSQETKEDGSDKTAANTSGDDQVQVAQKSRAVKHEWDPSKKDLMQAQKWFTLASRRPGQLGLEGKRLKAQVDEAIKKGGGASRNGRMCTIM
ncbi:hypothetical protein BGZ72_004869 [Mortierella alpina]|nr:hypothetical protein BGZ72_004869 [Mortierella alpina]